MSTQAPVTLDFHLATPDDCPLLAELNHQLIQDEGHRNQMTVKELEKRMRAWLTSEYRAVIFDDGREMIGYVLFRDQAEEIYLRQFFVVRNRRREGFGRQAFGILRSEMWSPKKRLTVDVLTENSAAAAFWRAVGCKDYSLTLEIMPKG